MIDVRSIAPLIARLTPAQLSALSREEDLTSLIAELRDLPSSPTIEAAIRRLEAHLYGVTLQPSVH